MTYYSVSFLGAKHRLLATNKPHLEIFFLILWIFFPVLTGLTNLARQIRGSKWDLNTRRPSRAGLSWVQSLKIKEVSVILHCLDCVPRVPFLSDSKLSVQSDEPKCPWALDQIYMIHISGLCCVFKTLSVKNNPKPDAATRLNRLCVCWRAPFGQH